MCIRTLGNIADMRMMLARPIGGRISGDGGVGGERGHGILDMCEKEDCPLRKGN
jgi:hypothetical protein